jgi:hypothetical protein
MSGAILPLPLYVYMMWIGTSFMYKQLLIFFKSVDPACCSSAVLDLRYEHKRAKFCWLYCNFFISRVLLTPSCIGYISFYKIPHSENISFHLAFLYLCSWRFIRQDCISTIPPVLNQPQVSQCVAHLSAPSTTT